MLRHPRMKVVGISQADQARHHATQAWHELPDQLRREAAFVLSQLKLTALQFAISLLYLSPCTHSFASSFALPLPFKASRMRMR
jgi:hypothetical protein